MQLSVPLLVLVAGILMLSSPRAWASGASAVACNAVCSRDYKPVCGDFQGVQKTFSNKCMMEYYNCLSRTDFVIVVQDECVGEAQT